MFGVLKMRYEVVFYITSRDNRMVCLGRTGGNTDEKVEDLKALKPQSFFDSLVDQHRVMLQYNHFSFHDLGSENDFTVEVIPDPEPHLKIRVWSVSGDEGLDYPLIAKAKIL